MMKYQISKVMRLLLLAVALCGISDAESFSFGAHEKILRDTLSPAVTGGSVDALALSQIIGSYLSGKGNLGSDQKQSDSFRHFDNAPNPTEICKLADAAWQYFFEKIKNSSQPAGPPDFRTLANADDARDAFGGLTHAVADFYAHSNWIDMAIDANVSPELAPIFPTCNPASLPAALHTGFFVITLMNGIDGCPDKAGRPAPPTPFVHCHLTLNKDYPNSGHGKDAVPGNPGLTYHGLATQLAAAHTIQIYNSIINYITASSSPTLNDVDGNCVAKLMFQASYNERCLRITGLWRVSASDPITSLPPLNQLWSFVHVNWEIVGGSISSVICTSLTLQVKAVHPGGFEGLALGCTTFPPPQFCPPQIYIPIQLAWTSPGVMDGIITAVDVEDRVECPVIATREQRFQLKR